MNEDRIFNGGNEFRFFDMSNLITGGQNTSNVTLNENGYQVKLRPEIKRTYKVKPILPIPSKLLGLVLGFQTPALNSKF